MVLKFAIKSSKSFLSDASFIKNPVKSDVYAGTDAYDATERDCIVGIGGGFLIIPTLVLFVRLPIKKAVATSMFIIAIKSLIGFMGDLENLEINWDFLLGFTTVSVLGIILGIYLSSYIAGEQLKKYFGWFVLITSLGIFYNEIFT